MFISFLLSLLAGALSTVLVNYLSYHVLSRKENREYDQKVCTANRETLFALRPSIAAKVSPTADTINAVRIATARRYAVRVESIYTLSEIADEITKEVMDSSFLSAKRKAEFCTELANLKNLPTVEQLATPSRYIPSIVDLRERDRMLRATVYTMAVVIGIGVSLVVFEYFAGVQPIASLELVSGIIGAFCAIIGTWFLVWRDTSEISKDSQQADNEKKA